MGITPELYELIVKIVEDKVKEIKVTKEAFDKLSQTIVELAEAQRQTERTLSELAEAQKRTESAVGMLSDNIGYGLEDIAKVVLPGVLKKNKAIEIGAFERKFITAGTDTHEIDLYGEGIRNGTNLILIGECKSRIYGREVEKFLNKCRDIEKVIQLPIFKFMFGYFIHPSAQAVADTHDIFLVVSYMR